MKLSDAWSRGTSADPEHWTTDNPALGQCAVSALIIQDLLGGQLLRTEINHVSYYWNTLMNGQQVDVTIQQFGKIWARGEIKVRDREYVLSFPDTVLRYEMLKKRLSE